MPSVTRLRRGLCCASFPTEASLSEGKTAPIKLHASEKGLDKEDLSLLTKKSVASSFSAEQKKSPMQEQTSNADFSKTRPSPADPSKTRPSSSSGEAVLSTREPSGSHKNLKQQPQVINPQTGQPLCAGPLGLLQIPASFFRNSLPRLATISEEPSPERQKRTNVFLDLSAQKKNPLYVELEAATKYRDYAPDGVAEFVGVGVTEKKPDYLSTKNVEHLSWVQKMWINLVGEGGNQTSWG